MIVLVPLLPVACIIAFILLIWLHIERKARHSTDYSLIESTRELNHNQNSKFKLLHSLSQYDERFPANPACNPQKHKVSSLSMNEAQLAHGHGYSRIGTTLSNNSNGLDDIDDNNDVTDGHDVLISQVEMTKQNINEQELQSAFNQPLNLSSSSGDWSNNQVLDPMGFDFNFYLNAQKDRNKQLSLQLEPYLKVFCQELTSIMNEIYMYHVQIHDERVDVSINISSRSSQSVDFSDITMIIVDYLPKLQLMYFGGLISMNSNNNIQIYFAKIERIFLTCNMITIIALVLDICKLLILIFVFWNNRKYDNGLTLILWPDWKVTKQIIYVIYIKLYKTWRNNNSIDLNKSIDTCTDVLSIMQKTIYWLVVAFFTLNMAIFNGCCLILLINIARQIQDNGILIWCVIVLSVWCLIILFIIFDYRWWSMDSAVKSKFWFVKGCFLMLFVLVVNATICSGIIIIANNVKSIEESADNLNLLDCLNHNSFCETLCLLPQQTLNCIDVFKHSKASEIAVMLNWLM